MKNKQNNKFGFTLVELLAVIVILAIILVIAVPKVMSVIEDSKKATLESTAKMIASSAEKAKVQNTVLGKDTQITCDSVAKINKLDYETYEVVFEDNTAKVSIKGSGKFAGLYVCSGDKTSATATSESCTPVVNGVNFSTDDWSTIVDAVKSGSYIYKVGDTKTVDMGSLGTHTLRVANTTKCSVLETEPLSKTACGFVLEFADIITTHEVNGDSVCWCDDTIVGGWPASEIRGYLNDLNLNSDADGIIYNALPKELRDGIINTYVVSSSGERDMTKYENVIDGNFYSTDKIYLLSPEEIYGTSFTSSYDTSNGTSRQLDYYANYQGEGYIGVSTTNYEGAMKKNGTNTSFWWLRSASSGPDPNGFGYSSFYCVATDGNWCERYTYLGDGVSPAFRLAE